MRHIGATVRAAFVACGLIALLAAPSAARAAVQYHFTPLEQGSTSGGFAINDYGQVVGAARFSSTGAFLWTPNSANGTDGDFSFPGVLQANNFSAAFGINAIGQITGQAGVSSANGGNHPFLWTPSTPHGTTGAIKDIFAPGSTGYGLAINDPGQISLSIGVAGPSYGLWTPSTPNGNTGSSVTLGAGQVTYHSINNYGQVVSNNGLWTPSMPNGTTGTFTAMQPGGARMAAINVVGQLVGQNILWTPNTPNGSTGSTTNLGLMGNGDTFTNAEAINDSGQVVGYSGYSPGTPHVAFLWSAGGGMVDVNTLITDGSNQDWSIYEARGINNLGQIVGIAEYRPPDGSPAQEHTYLLTPMSLLVPEPTGLTLFACGSVLLVRRRRRTSLKSRE